MNGTSAFDGISTAYARYRPQYPLEVMQRMWDYVLIDVDVLRATGLAVDVGAGTGISTLGLRRTAPDWIEIVAVEPGQDMRLEAERALDGQDRVTVVDGRAESLPFADGTVSVALAAQAIQWFEREVFYREARRVLQSGGCLALLQNNRNWRVSALLEAYENFLEKHGESYSRHYRDLPLAAELETLAGFDEAVSVRVDWLRTMKMGEIIGLALSSTKMRPAVTRYGEETVIALLSDVLGQYADDDGDLDVPYATELFMARRALAE